MDLSEVFSAIAHKELVRVDLPNLGSNQHELNGVSGLRDFFRSNQTVKGRLQWVYFADGQEAVEEEGSFTFYDARARDPNRSEWRLYYTGDFLARANPGDLLLLARLKTDAFYAMVFESESDWSRAVDVLISLGPAEARFEAVGPDDFRQRWQHLGAAMPDRLVHRQLALPRLGPSN